MSDPVIVGVLSGVGAVGVREVIAWLRNRRKDDAETGLTIDQRWERYTETLEDRLGKLETRVTDLEQERETLLERVKALVAEVDHYRRVARSMARHVLRLRDALAAAGADVPVMPTDIEDALTIIDLP